jgi:hypothetical protein
MRCLSSKCPIIRSMPREMMPNRRTVIGVQCHLFHIVNMRIVLLRCSAITSEGKLPSPRAMVWSQRTAPQPLPHATWEACPPACAAYPSCAPTALHLAAGRSGGRGAPGAWRGILGGQGVRSRRRRANRRWHVLYVARPAYEEQHAHEDAPASLFPSPPLQNSACASVQEKASHALPGEGKKSI